MKPNSKNLWWIFISISSLIIFLFATLVVGFKFENRIPSETDLSRIISENPHNDNFTDPTIGLLVSGLVISGLTVILVVIKYLIDIFNLNGFLANKVWDYLFLGLIIIASLLLIIGSGLYIGMVLNVPGTSAKAVPGNDSLLFALLILPIIIAIMPLSVDWYKRYQKKKAPKTKKKVK